MKCPHCEKKLELIAPAFIYVETYGGYAQSVTSCCGNIVQVRRIISYGVSIPFNHDSLKEDDWGNKKNKNNKL